MRLYLPLQVEMRDEIFNFETFINIYKCCEFFNV